MIATEALRRDRVGVGGVTYGLLLAQLVVAFCATPLFALPPEDPSSRPPLLTVPAPEADARTPTWVGEHVGLGVGAVAGTAATAAAGLSLHGRFATFMQLVDVELIAAGNRTAQGSRLQAVAQLNLHPSFIAIVWRNLWGVLVSGFHGFVGVGAARVSGQFAGWAALKQLGVGLDVPLTSLEAEAGLWLTFRGGVRWLPIAAGTPNQANANQDDRYASLSVSWRWYDVLR